MTNEANTLAESQARNNASTREAWEAYRRHRERVTGLLLEAAPATPQAPGRLCVLGAGNCNDLDLRTLSSVYREIHLVDLDGGTLERGAARQSHGGVHLHGGVDLTGVLDDLAGWGAAGQRQAERPAVTDQDLTACVDRPVQRVGSALPGPFDVVVSTCVLSQLLAAVVHALGAGHPRFLPTLLAVRAGHLRLLAALTAPGGLGILVSDLVSSDTCPALLTEPPRGTLPALAERLIREGNFFHGTNPAPITAFLCTDPVVAGETTFLGWATPWRWDLGPRAYLVHACAFRKNPGARGSHHRVPLPAIPH